MKKRFFLVTVLIVLVLQIQCGYGGYSGNYALEAYKWSKVEYENLPLSDDTWIGPYRYNIPENTDVVSSGYHPASGLMLVILFRCRPGVPITVGAFCAKDYKYGSSPKIWGFPNYKINTLQASYFAGGSDEEQTRREFYKPSQYRPVGNYYSGQYYTSNYYDYVNQHPVEEKRIISVFHINIEERCSRVFLLDNGLLQFYQNTTYTVQKSALIEIALPSNGCENRNFPITRRSELPDSIIAKGQNGLMYITFDFQSEGSCDDLFLYITNPFYGYLIVYDYKKDKFWAFDHESFHPVVAESHFVFDRTYNLDMPLGLMSVSLDYPDENGDRRAFYNPFASTAEYAVSTKVLKNSRLSPNNFNQNDFKIIGYRGCEDQVGKTIIDYTYGVMFFAGFQSYEISCWNINKPFNPDNIGVVYRSEKILFTAQMFSDSRGYLWFHTCHVPIEFLTDLPLNLQEVNSRIFRVKISDAIRGTVCEDPDQYRLSDLYV